MAEEAPIDKGSKEETFTDLAKDFNFDDKVKDLFLKGPMQNLQDLRYYFATESDIDSFVAAETSLKDAALRIQIARVRRAWAAVRLHGTQKENRNNISSVAQLDDLLEEGTLREVKVNFWKRYKLKYPSEVWPADQLLSRCYREMDKRLLTVYDIWKVKTLLHQVMSTKKRKLVGTDLYTFEDEPETIPDSHVVDKYLSSLHTYLLAMSVAGSSKAHNAPADEAFGGDSTKFVKVPWDVMQAYLFRASRSAMQLPESSRLAWLEERDIAERAVWVSLFRDGDDTLGHIVQSVMEKRSAHWDAPISHAIPRQPSYSSPQDPRSPQMSKKQKQNQKGSPQKGSGKKAPFPPVPPPTQAPQKPGSLATALRDGTALCQDFNRGKCLTKGPSCARGAHKCAKIGRNGRPCGMSFHGAHNCRNSS